MTALKLQLTIIIGLSIVAVADAQVLLAYRWREVQTTHVDLEFESTVQYSDAERQKALIQDLEMKTPTITQRLQIRDNKVFYQKKAWTYEVAAKQFVHLTVRTTNNGVESQLLNAFPAEKQKMDYGVINPATLLGHRNELTLPILSILRGANSPISGFQIGQFQKTDRTKEIADSECIEFERFEKSRTTRVWLDPKSDWVVRREELFVHERLVRSTDVTSIREPSTRHYLPWKWTVTIFQKDGNVESTYQNRVTKADLKTQIPDERFELKIPPGLLAK